MNSLTDLIAVEIKKRPAMYIGRNSIFSLHAFLGGVCMKNTYYTDLEVLSDFQDYIQKKYRIRSSHSWASIIHFYSADECHALKQFFELFDEFLLTRKPVG